MFFFLQQKNAWTKNLPPIWNLPNLAVSICWTYFNHRLFFSRFYYYFLAIYIGQTNKDHLIIYSQLCLENSQGYSGSVNCTPLLKHILASKPGLKISVMVLRSRAWSPRQHKLCKMFPISCVWYVRVSDPGVIWGHFCFNYLSTLKSSFRHFFTFLYKLLIIWMQKTWYLPPIYLSIWIYEITW